VRRIVLAHSGGPDTLAAIPGLAARFQAEVVTLTLDLGQGGDLTDVRERALAAGAARAHVIDAREEFARDFLLPSLHAAALDRDGRPQAAAIGRALIAKRLVDVAQMESAFAVAYGRGLETAVRVLDPSLAVVSIGGNVAEKTWPGSANLWGRCVTGEGAFTLTRAAADCPDEPASLEIEFEAGIPVRANGIEMSMLELIESVEIIAGAHGVGRLEYPGPRANATRAEPEAGLLADEVPAAVVLHLAHRELEALVTPPDFARLKLELSAAYSNLVREGRWFSPTREAIDAFVGTIQPRVTGSIRLDLFRGECRVLGRTSPFEWGAPPAAHATDPFDAVPAEGLVS
jgi:argininosuccinate synthase